ncbi:hypothetical protein BO78DRAFT_415927 [Aspergillus sclerotiicarbonarius CBS 121057]|uniref:Uncharacterized protein n=1 Tax=Aspergillus sclerotiicarbonarius (strain CBS 121057 / IBT 28362) TaxID=1448318 RepID=A0A319EQK8_ASPSB|nr:hypothetical protein BO78DRAFT_415927 [Aspergillus sclerotiicarbonarius CBS 121057]
MSVEKFQRWHGDLLGLIGQRLGAWKLQQLKCNDQGRKSWTTAVDKIMQSKPTSELTSREEILAEVKKNPKGSYWSHVVQHAANNDPNILCLLPHTMTIGPPHKHRSFVISTYRDLAVPECKVVGEVLRQLQPNLLLSVDAELSRDLLYAREPGSHYILEETDDQQIKNATLGSDTLLSMLRKTATSASPGTQGNDTNPFF